MKKQILLITFFFFSNILHSTDPKVALVLSGGGAKGIAQIPIMEMIDSLNIPIDYVIGTPIKLERTSSAIQIFIINKKISIGSS